MTTSRKFALGDVLSVTTGKLVSPRHMAGIYDILNFMTDDNLYTHQLPRVMDECAPYLFEQFPQLREVDASSVTKENWQEWLAEQMVKHGSTLDVAKLPPGVHYHIEPLSELAEKVHPSQIIVVDPNG